MGYFSWHTQDTKKSIANRYSPMAVFTVYLHDDKGRKWQEDNYEGYGVFGGKDFYELLAEMNGLKPDRQIGIDLFFSNDPTDIRVPNLTESSEWKHINEMPTTCPDQGIFYPPPDNHDEEQLSYIIQK